MAPEGAQVDADRFRWVVRRPHITVSDVDGAIATRPATASRVEDVAGFVTVTLLLGVLMALVLCAIGVWQTLP